MQFATVSSNSMT